MLSRNCIHPNFQGHIFNSFSSAFPTEVQVITTMKELPFGTIPAGRSFHVFNFPDRENYLTLTSPLTLEPSTLTHTGFMHCSKDQIAVLIHAKEQAADIGCTIQKAPSSTPAHCPWEFHCPRCFGGIPLPRLFSGSS